ncbi:MAG TPA: SDR family oxidoreductase [Dehalococcoidia bacterium]|nr:SDR family oxidoreductase [Dehalococcoidia bacterium]
MRALVTGGAGFIGSHLAERLLAEGHQVAVLDNLAAGRLKNLSHLGDRKGLSVHRADVQDLDSIRPLFEGVDWVFHLAALADIVPSIVSPLAYHRANVGGTASVLEASRGAKVRRFIYAASSSCYGLPKIFPTPETAEIQPQYPYALTKYIGEQYVLHWGRVYGLPVLSLRLFNVYGPRSRTSGAYGAVFGVFLAQKLHGEPFTVVGDGTQSRDFTFVSDVVEAMVMAARSDLRQEVLNVGSGQTSSVNRLVELLGGQVVHVPKRPGEPDRTHADISKIQRLLGWQPRVSFENGVRAMLENIEYWREAPLWTPETIAEATRAWFQHLSP